MASITTIADATLHNPPTPATHAVAEVLVCLPSISPDAIPAALEAIAAAFPGESVLVAAAAHPDTAADWPSLELIPYARTLTDVGWVLAAADYAAAAHIAADRHARAVVLFGDDTALVNAPLLRSLVDTVRLNNVDLALPRFSLGPNDALVNSALLYPLSRALFGADIHFPLPVDAALSTRMAQRLLPSTQRLVNLSQGASLLWPVTEAAVAGLSVREVPAGDGPPPPPPPPPTPRNALPATNPNRLQRPLHQRRRLPLLRHRRQGHLLAARPRPAPPTIQPHPSPGPRSISRLPRNSRHD
jgi:hypothetical protein